MYIAVKLRMIGMAIILAFVVASSFILMLGKYHPVLKGWAFVSLPLALFLFFQRDTYLPFLGQAALPASLLKEVTVPDNANVTVNLPMEAPNGTKVVYWGAMPSEVVYPTPWDAYGAFPNAGVTVVKNGIAVVRFHCPSKYKIPTGRTLNRHIHYRVMGENGMLGSVETKYVQC